MLELIASLSLHGEHKLFPLAHRLAGMSGQGHILGPLGSFGSLVHSRHLLALPAHVITPLFPAHLLLLLYLVCVLYLVHLEWCIPHNLALRRVAHSTVLRELVDYVFFCCFFYFGEQRLKFVAMPCGIQLKG